MGTHPSRSPSRAHIQASAQGQGGQQVHEPSACTHDPVVHPVTKLPQTAPVRASKSSGQAGPDPPLPPVPPPPEALEPPCPPSAEELVVVCPEQPVRPNAIHKQANHTRFITHGA